MQYVICFDVTAFGCEQTSLYVKAFCEGIEQLLQEYKNNIIVLSASICSRNCLSSYYTFFAGVFVFLLGKQKFFEGNMELRLHKKGIYLFADYKKHFDKFDKIFYQFWLTDKLENKQKTKTKKKNNNGSMSRYLIACAKNQMKGGRLLTKMFDLIMNNSGIPFMKQHLIPIQRKILSVWYNQMISFVAFGHLSDPLHEFVIRQNDRISTSISHRSSSIISWCVCVYVYVYVYV
ncbi:hypothetical protein RFI_07807 [Reticulomyxa filosa]|uniref:Gamma tubulin complex component protein N-terminal domain-containing protein n=1 Tax=Reticulomyxa filosa TaxID=46433 RepID=X6NTK1_RETFI|nr:hypothetical protein RFI_07807 [Reticulomyxa filosa]|eukprot:ETO29311.1 hypothetical protein RFI_07807 [Reticulomyxa filosa]